VGLSAAHKQPIRLLMGCLNLLRWALWAMALTLTGLLIVQKLHDDPALRPVAQVAAIAAFMLVGKFIGTRAQRLQQQLNNIDAMNHNLTHETEE